jgi:hypothetical protein
MEKVYRELVKKRKSKEVLSMKQRFYNAILVLLGARKAYNPKTHFISRYSGPRKKKPAYEEGEQET